MARNDRKSRPRPRVLFALSHVGYLRNFERAMLELVARGFDVHVAYGKEHEWLQASDYDDRLLSDIALHPMEAEPELPADPIAFLRLLRDTMFFARREFRDAHFLRKRFLETKTVRKLVTPKMLSALEALPASDRLLIDDLLAQIDASHPASRVVTQLVEAIEPKVIVVSPYLVLFSREVEFAKAAREKGVPLVYAAASWDNLTTKNVIKVQPDLVAVWNEAMADEAVTFHRVDRSKVEVTGAPVFDWWFDRHRALDRRAFLSEVGFDNDRPVLLYVCSSTAIGDNEAEVFDRWREAVRSSPDPSLRDANILIRPHPVAEDIWRERIAAQARGEASPACRIYPTTACYPTKDSQRSAFFNSICHASAVVGLNTSAMIEAAILDKPVLTFKGHGSEDSQVGNLHFRHLVESGCVHVADGMESHVAALLAALEDPQKHSRARRRFVHRFVRPLGPDKAPSTILAGLIAGQTEPKKAAGPRRVGRRLKQFRRALLGKPKECHAPADSGGKASAKVAAPVPAHWKGWSWEEKAQENPLFAIMTTDEMAHAPADDFSPEHVATLFAKGRKLFKQHLKPVLKDMPPGDGTLVVEYGCGAGRILRSVVDNGYRCAGIDISETMLKHCRQLVPEVEDLALLDAANRCSLASESASLVYSYAVLQHIASLSAFSAAIDEICRVLKPGGTALLQVNCCDFEHGDPERPWRTENYEDHSLHFSPGQAKPVFKHPQDNWSGVYIGYDRLTRMLAEHGVTMERWYHHSSAKPRSIWTVARKPEAVSA